jgi:hypothetical protein
MIETADRTSPIGFDVKTVRPYEKIALLRQRCVSSNKSKGS